MGIPENSYNSALKSAQEEEDENAILGQSVIAICEQIELRRIEAGILLGKIDIKDFYVNKDEYELNLHITRKIKGHIDPVKQRNSEALAVLTGTESRVSIIASANHILLNDVRS